MTKGICMVSVYDDSFRGIVRNNTLQEYRLSSSAERLIAY